MILRKPYAFLIKHFKLIHLLLTIVLGVILYQTNIIYKFFRDYIINTNYLNLYIEPEITSVGALIFIMVFIAIAISITIFILMNRKKKPTKFYFISIIYYSIFAMFLFIANSQLYTLLLDRATLTTISMIRDLLNAFYLSQYVFLFMTIIRAIGFNIKKFDFQSDLKELNIQESDNEEFEFEVKIDTDDVRMKTRRTLRIAKYVIQENKKLFIFLGGITLLIIAINILLNAFIYNRLYKHGESFDVGSITYKVLDSFETTKNYSLKQISKDNIYYAVVLELTNNADSKKTLNLEHISLRTDERISYKTNTKIYSNFVDLGVGYSKQPLAPKSTSVYILVFEVSNEQKDNDKILEILRGYVVKEGVKEYRYSKVKLEPTQLDKIEFIKESKLGNTLVIDDNVIGNISLNVENYEILDKIEHSYKETINNKEYTFVDIIQPSYDDYYGKKLLNLKVKIDLSQISNEKSINKFLGKYSVIRYIKDGKEYTSPFRGEDLTPDSVVDNIYLEVPEEVSTASNIYLDIIIRNKKYTYVLK